MHLDFVVVLAVGSLSVSLVSVWYAARVYKRLITLKKFEAERDLRNTQPLAHL